MKYFVILLQGLTDNNVKRASEVVAAQGCGWWHYMPGSMLVIGGAAHITAPWLREQVRQVAASPDNVSIMVLEVDPREWSGWMSTDWPAWLLENWPAHK